MSAQVTDRCRGKAILMSPGASFRKKAAESLEAIKDTEVSDDIRKFELAAKSFAQLAENEDWLAQNFNSIIHSHELNSPNEALGKDLDNGGIAKIEEHIL